MREREPETTSQIQQARRAGLLSATGLATYLFCIWTTSPWLGFDMAAVTPPFVALIVVNALWTDLFKPLTVGASLGPAAAGLVVIALGLPVYFLLRSRASRT